MAIVLSGTMNDILVNGVSIATDTEVSTALAGKANTAEVNSALAGKQTNLGFTPVQQGTGIGQSSNVVKIGWTGNRTKITIDATDMGNIVMDSNIGVANSSLVKTALNASGEAPIYACRAWVNFNGTGTVAIRASGNVSSITDYGVGDYGVNFSTGMVDANYSISSVCTGGNNLNFGGARLSSAPLSSGFRYCDAHTSTGALQDEAYQFISVFR